MPSIIQPTPQERLASSRKAIVRHMAREREASGAGEGSGQDAPGTAGPHAGGNWGVIKQTLRSWWHHHPASMALDVAQPVIGRYAEENPLKLLAIAAGVGAAAVVLKPWRLISVGGLLLATLKSSQLSGALLSLLSGASREAEQTSRVP